MLTDETGGRDAAETAVAVPAMAISAGDVHVNLANIPVRKFGGSLTIVLTITIVRPPDRASVRCRLVEQFGLAAARQ